MDEKLQEAVEYASGSNGLEDLYLSDGEIQKIISDIKEGRSDESFLYSIVKLARAKEKSMALKKENQHVQSRK